MNLTNMIKKEVCKDLSGKTRKRFLHEEERKQQILFLKAREVWS